MKWMSLYMAKYSIHWSTKEELDNASFLLSLLQICIKSFGGTLSLHWDRMVQGHNSTDYVYSVLLVLKIQLPDSLWRGGLPWSEYIPMTSVRDLNTSCSALWYQLSPFLKLDCPSMQLCWEMICWFMLIHKNHRQCLIDYWSVKCTCHSH